MLSRIALPEQPDPTWSIRSGWSFQRWLGCLMLILAVWIPVPAFGQVAAAPEYTVKAGYLILFAGYTTWPTNRFETTNSPIVIGVIGADPFGDVLDRTAAAQTRGRPIVVQRVSSAEAAAQCHLVFISHTESRNEVAWLEQFKGKPILTVSDSDRAIEHGSVVQFVNVGKSLRFDVGWPGMKEAGIRLGSEMLDNARKVHQLPGGR